MSLIQTVCDNRPLRIALLAELTEELWEESSEINELNDETSLDRNPVAFLTCAIQKGQLVTDQNGLETIWEIYEPELQEHLQNLMDCAGAEACLYSEMILANATLREFRNAVQEVSFKTDSVDSISNPILFKFVGGRIRRN